MEKLDQVHSRSDPTSGCGRAIRLPAPMVLRWTVRGLTLSPKLKSMSHNAGRFTRVAASRLIGSRNSSRLTDEPTRFMRYYETYGVGFIIARLIALSGGRSQPIDEF